MVALLESYEEQTNVLLIFFLKKIIRRPVCVQHELEHKHGLSMCKCCAYIFFFLNNNVLCMYQIGKKAHLRNFFWYSKEKLLRTSQNISITWWSCKDEHCQNNSIEQHTNSIPNKKRHSYSNRMIMKHIIFRSCPSIEKKKSTVLVLV